MCSRTMAASPHLQLTGVATRWKQVTLQGSTVKRRPHHGSNSFLGPDCFPSLAGEGETPASKIIFNVLDTHPTKVDGNFSGHIHSNYRSEIPHPNYETIYHTFTQYGTFTSEGPVSCNNRLIWKLHSPEGNLVTFF